MRYLIAALLVSGLVADALGQSLPVASITGQPFSADEVIVENARPNVHGAVPMKTVRVYRDSAGRTRTDVSVPPDRTATPFVSIQDPVAGVRYLLDAQNKVARRFTSQPPREKPGTEPPAPGASAFFGTALPLPFGGHAHPPPTIESLGTQVLEGFSAEGERITSTGAAIPGCNQSVAVAESWYSPELRMTMLQTHSNCFGEGSARLANIDRAEPDPFLFGAPSDYAIVEQERGHGVNPFEPAVPPMPPVDFPRLPPPPLR